MKIANFLKTLEIDGATFRYEIPWKAKQGFLALAAGMQDNVSEETKQKVLQAKRENRDLTEAEMAEMDGGDLDVARAVEIFMGSQCLRGWDGVTFEDKDGEEKPLAFSHQAAQNFLPGDVLIALAMDAFSKAMQGGN